MKLQKFEIETPRNAFFMAQKYNFSKILPSLHSKLPCNPRPLSPSQISECAYVTDGIVANCIQLDRNVKSGLMTDP